MSLTLASRKTIDWWFLLTPQLAALSPAGAQPPRRFAWGVCVPAQCNAYDAAGVGNFLLSVATGAIPPQMAAIVPQLALLKNLKVTPVGAVCRGSDDPAPEVKPWMGVFYAFLALIGVLTISGTALDFFERRASTTAARAKIGEMELKQMGQGGVCNGGFQGDGIQNGKRDLSGNCINNSVGAGKAG